MLPGSRLADESKRTERFALTGQSGRTNKYAAECWDAVISLALAMELSGPKATPLQIAQNLRKVTNGPGEAVYDFASGKAALKHGAIMLGGAAGRIFIDAKGNNQGSLFSWDVITGGAVKTKKKISFL